MGFRFAWFARPGRVADELLADAGRGRSGERSDFPEIGWYLAELPARTLLGGLVLPESTLLLASGTEHYFDLVELMPRWLADGRPGVAFHCNDTVMQTGLEVVERTGARWSLSVDPHERLMIVGELPQGAQRLVESAREEQRSAGPEVDALYDLTAAIGEELTGFRHDLDLDLPGLPEPFEELR